MPRLLAVFDRPDHTAEAVTHLKGRGFDDLETYAPAPFPEVEDAVDPKPSRVRLWTLIGCLLGVVTGYASLMVSILFLSGVQLTSMGIIGIYMSTIFKEVKGRPAYIVAKARGFDRPGAMAEAEGQ